MSFPRLLLCILATTTFLSQVSSQNKKGSKLSKASNCFTLDLYQKLPKDQENIIVSPYSAAVVLSMLLAGAGGSTAEELSKALGYNDQQLSVCDMEKIFKSDLNNIQSSAENTLNIANSVWIQDGHPIKDDFNTSVTQNFHATEQILDFQNQTAESTAIINDWVNNRTNGLIPKLFDEDIGKDAVMVLVNAIYFKGTWARKFNPEYTTKELFYNNGDENQGKIVPFMHLKGKSKYMFERRLNSQVLEMDYAGGDTSMVIVLPSENSTLDSLEEDLSCELLKDGFRTSTKALVDVSIPKYKVESKFDLKEPLKKLNISDLFESEADLTGIGPNLKVSVIVQKALIKVYEEGSEAAAASGVVILLKSGARNPRNPIIFKANRPFLYFIRHNPTNTILFFGRIKKF